MTDDYAQRLLEIVKKEVQHVTIYPIDGHVKGEVVLLKFGDSIFCDRIPSSINKQNKLFLQDECLGAFNKDVTIDDIKAAV